MQEFMGTFPPYSVRARVISRSPEEVFLDEITLVGSRCGPFPPALQLLAQKRVHVNPLIHARYRLEDAEAAFERAQRPEVLKVLLEMD